MWDRLSVHKSKEVIWALENDGWRLHFIPDKAKFHMPCDNSLFKDFRIAYRKTPLAERATFVGKTKHVVASLKKVCTKARVVKDYGKCGLSVASFGKKRKAPVPERYTAKKRKTVTRQKKKVLEIQWTGGKVPAIFKRKSKVVEDGDEEEDDEVVDLTEALPCPCFR